MQSDEKIEDISPFLYNFTINFTSELSLSQSPVSGSIGV